MSLILGLADKPLDDGLPHTLLTYANGPGFYNNIMINEDGNNVTRLNLTTTNFTNDRKYRYTTAGWRDDTTVKFKKVHNYRCVTF